MANESVVVSYGCPVVSLVLSVLPVNVKINFGVRFSYPLPQGKNTPNIHNILLIFHRNISVYYNQQDSPFAVSLF
jgi:hypothetical protein